MLILAAKPAKAGVATALISESVDRPAPTADEGARVQALFGLGGSLEMGKLFAEHALHRNRHRLE